MNEHTSALMRLRALYVKSELQNRLVIPHGETVNGVFKEAPKWARLLLRKHWELALDTLTLHFVEEEADDAAIEKEALSGKCIVVDLHTPEGQKAGLVPLRWGAPRVLLVRPDSEYAKAIERGEEPIESHRLWRYRFDPMCDAVLACTMSEAKELLGA